jgi:hypothetical protein
MGGHHRDRTGYGEQCTLGGCGFAAPTPAHCRIGGGASPQALGGSTPRIEEPRNGRMTRVKPTGQFQSERSLTMPRKVFDKLTSGVGVILVVVLLIAGGLMTWGHSFANSNVHNQLAQQQILFPTATEINAVKAQYAKGGQAAVTDPEFPDAAVMIPALEPYAGQQLLTGAGAQVYADDFIAKHLYAMPYHGVYSLVSTASRIAKPGSAAATQLAGLETTVFQGTTLRGLLLEAYGFGTIATILLWGAIVSFIGAALLAVLVGLGFWHAARVPEEVEILTSHKVAAAA